MMTSMIKLREKKPLQFVRKNLSSIHEDIHNFVSKINSGGNKNKRNSSSQLNGPVDGINDHCSIQQLLQKIQSNDQETTACSSEEFVCDNEELLRHLRSLSTTFPNLVLPTSDYLHTNISLYSVKLEPHSEFDKSLDENSTSSDFLNSSDPFSLEFDKIIESKTSLSLSATDSLDSLDFSLSRRNTSSCSSSSEGSFGFSEIIRTQEERQNQHHLEKFVNECAETSKAAFIENLPVAVGSDNSNETQIYVNSEPIPHISNQMLPTNSEKNGRFEIVVDDANENKTCDGKGGGEDILLVDNKVNVLPLLKSKTPFIYTEKMCKNVKPPDHNEVQATLVTKLRKSSSIDKEVVQESRSSLSEKDIDFQSKRQQNNLKIDSKKTDFNHDFTCKPLPPTPPPTPVSPSDKKMGNNDPTATVRGEKRSLASTSADLAALSVQTFNKKRAMFENNTVSSSEKSERVKSTRRWKSSVYDSFSNPIIASLVRNSFNEQKSEPIKAKTTTLNSNKTSPLRYSTIATTEFDNTERDSTMEDRKTVKSSSSTFEERRGQELDAILSSLKHTVQLMESDAGDGFSDNLDSNNNMGIATPTPFSALHTRKFKPISLKPKLANNRETNSSNKDEFNKNIEQKNQRNISLNIITAQSNHTNENQNYIAASSNEALPSSELLSNKTDVVERAYTDDDIDDNQTDIKKPCDSVFISSSLTSSDMTQSVDSTYAALHALSGDEEQVGPSSADFVSPPLPPPPSAEDLLNATSSGRTSVISFSSLNDDNVIFSPTYKASADTAIWAPSKSPEPVEKKQTPLYATQTQKSTAKHTFAKSWNDDSGSKAFKSVSKPVLRKNNGTSDSPPSTITKTTTYSLPQSATYPSQTAANVQVTPTKDLPPGAVYETKTIEDNKVHTDTYYAVPDQDKPVYERTKTTKVILAPHYQGMGPVDDKGVPVALRSTVDDQKSWYKNMFKQIHNQEEKEKESPKHSDAAKYYGINETNGTAGDNAQYHPVVHEALKARKFGKITEYTPSSPYVVENKPEKKNITTSSYKPYRAPQQQHVQRNPEPKNDLHLVVDDSPIPHTSTSYHAPRKVSQAELEEEENILKEASKLDDIHMPKFFRKSTTEEPQQTKKPSKQQQAATQPKMKRKEGIAKFNFSPQTGKEMALKKGQRVVITNAVDDNWYMGESLDGKVSGIIPVSYVEICATKPAPRKHGLAKAKFNFTAQVSTQLSFEKEQEIILTDKIDANWYKATIGSQSGIIPSNYIEVISDPEQKQKTQQQSLTNQLRQVELKSPAPVQAKPAAPPVFESETEDPGEKLRMSKASYLANTVVNSHQQLQPKDHRRNKSDFDMTEIDEIVSGIEPGTTTSTSTDITQQTEEYVTLYPYQPSNEDELELVTGDRVLVIEKCDDGWFVGSNKRTGAFGTFPGNYVAPSNS